MFHFLLDPLHVPYVARAACEVVLLAVLGALVGVHIVLRRLAFLTDAVQHAVFPGIAIAFTIGGSLLVGALAGAALAVLLLVLVSARRAIDQDAFLAVVVSTFVAVGVVVVSRRRGFQADLTALLFGRILAVDGTQIAQTSVVVVIAALVLIGTHKELVLLAFDRTSAEAFGYRVARLDLALELTVALGVVAAVRAVGTVLVVAFLVTPAATARVVTARIGRMVSVAFALAVGAGWLGLAISYEASVHHGVRLAAGATIVMVLTAQFLAAVGVRAVVTADRRRSATTPPEPVAAPEPARQPS